MPVPAPSAPATVAPARVLVVEDNAVNQKVTLLQLRNFGFAADLAGNGREAIEAIRRQPYVLVLMDAQMPEMDGMAATRLIRAAQAAGDPSFPRELRIIAMDDYLPKPVRPEDLRAVLDRYVPRAHGADLVLAR